MNVQNIKTFSLSTKSTVNSWLTVIKQFTNSKQSFMGYSLRHHAKGHPTQFEPHVQRMHEHIVIGCALSFWIIMIPIMILKVMTLNGV